MRERLQYMLTLWRAGLLQMRGLYAYLLGLGTSVTALAALSPDMWPSRLAPFHDGIVEIGKWAVIFGIVMKTIQAQSKKVVPDLPPDNPPTLPKGDVP